MVSDTDYDSRKRAKRTDVPRAYAPDEAKRGQETAPPESVSTDSGSAGLLNPVDEGRSDSNAGRAERDLLSPEALNRHFEMANAANDTADALRDAAEDSARKVGATRAPSRRAAEGDDGEDQTRDQGDPTAKNTAKSGKERRDTDERREKSRDSKDRRGASSGWQIRPTPGTKDDPLLGCLTILCTLLERNISSEALTSALPMVDGMLTPELFVRAAERAGISARLQRRDLNSLTKLSLPCVLLLSRQRACVLTDIKRNEGRATIILPEMGAGTRDVAFDELIAEYVGYALFARPEFQYDKRAQDDRIADPKGWFWGTLLNSWKLYIEVGIAAIMVNCFAIASPLFTMNVYDRVVPNFAEATLWVLAIGISIVYGFDFMLKLIRGYLVDVAGKTADTKIAARLFQQVMGMKMANRPPSAGGLANSMREFENLREFFTSSTVIALVDFPFIFLFLGVISIIGSPMLVLIPGTMVLIAIAVGFIVQVQMRKIVQETFREAQQKHAILIEAISGAETIKATASEGRMQRSWETFVSKTAASSMKATRWSQFALNLSGFFYNLGVNWFLSFMRNLRGIASFFHSMMSFGGTIFSRMSFSNHY